MVRLWFGVLHALFLVLGNLRRSGECTVLRVRDQAKQLTTPGHQGEFLFSGAGPQHGGPHPSD